MSERGPGEIVLSASDNELFLQRVITGGYGTVCVFFYGDPNDPPERRTTLASHPWATGEVLKEHDEDEESDDQEGDDAADDSYDLICVLDPFQGLFGTGRVTMESLLHEVALVMMGWHQMARASGMRMAQVRVYTSGDDPEPLLAIAGILSGASDQDRGQFYAELPRLHMLVLDFVPHESP